MPDDLASDDLVLDVRGSDDRVVDVLGSEALVVDDRGVIDRVLVSRERVGGSYDRGGVRLTADRVDGAVVGGRYGSTFERAGPRGTITRVGCEVEALRSRV